MLAADLTDVRQTTEPTSASLSGTSFNTRGNMAIDEIPPYHFFHWPALQAVIGLGGSASIADLETAVLDHLDFTPEALETLHRDGPMTEVQYRLAWARTYLKGMGLLTNSQRGIWSVTEQGQKVTEEELPKLRAEYLATFKRNSETKKRKKAKPSQSELDNELDQAETEAEYEWKDTLLDTLMDISPKAFEKLALRLLREAGVQGLVLTGGSGDDGIDGRGVYKMELVSFPVFFQCKRYRGSVGPSTVRDFRGAMAGRGEKGLLITTGTFTSSANAEARRDGAPPVDLVDGDELCDLLKRYKIGVTSKMVEDVQVDLDFFRSFEPPTA
jgi:restriction system protein